MTIVEEIKELVKNLTLYFPNETELGKKLGVGNSTVNCWKKGDIKDSSRNIKTRLDQLRKLMQELKRKKLLPQLKPNKKFWNGMIIHRMFTVQDLMIVSGKDYYTTAKYVQGLLRFGYLKKLMTKRRPDEFAVYSLVKKTGPEAPKLRYDGKRLYDPNLDKEVGLD